MRPAASPTPGPPRSCPPSGDRARHVPGRSGAAPAHASLTPLNGAPFCPACQLLPRHRAGWAVYGLHADTPRCHAWGPGRRPSPGPPERPPSLGRGLSRHHRLSRARYPSPRPISGSRLTSGAAGGWSYEKLGFGCPDTLAAEGELHEGCRWPSPPSPRPHRPPPGLLPRGGWSHTRGPGARSSFRLDDASPRALTDGSLPSSSLRRLPTGPARPLRRGPCCPLGPWLHLTRPSHVRLPRPSPSARAKFLEGRTRLRGPRHLHPADGGLGSARQTGLDRLFVHWETKSILSRHGKPALLCEQTVPPEELLVQHVPWTLTSRRSDFVQNQQDKTPTARSQGHRRRARGPALPTARPAPALPTHQGPVQNLLRKASSTNTPSLQGHSNPQGAECLRSLLPHATGGSKV